MMKPVKVVLSICGLILQDRHCRWCLLTLLVIVFVWWEAFWQLKASGY